MRHWTTLLALAAFVPGSALAQDATPTPRPAPAVTLSLAEALRTARSSSPAYRQVLNDAGPARWGVRNAYASLLPTAQVSGGMSYTGAGASTFGGTNFSQTSPALGSNYSLSLSWQLDGRTLSAPGREKANQRATTEDINNADIQLRTDITVQYLTTLQSTAQVEVARQQVERNSVFLQLARARYEVGQATLLDVRQAEVTKGQSDVALLRAVQTENEAKLELFRRMGVTPPAPVGTIALPDSFPVEAPTHDLSTLLQLAEDQNPALRALRAREDAATWGVRSAKSAFLPSLSASAGWSGFTQEFTNEGLLLSQALGGAQGSAANCLFQNGILERLTSPHPAPNGGIVPDCNGFAGLNAAGTALQDPVRDRIINSNNVFPFDFTRQPFQARLTISLPVFTGFSRSLQLSQARANQQDAEEGVRARALQVRAEVEARHLGLQTAYQSIQVQAANRDAAREQLRLAQDRYRLGSGTSLELSDAQNAVQRAEGDYVNSVYDYHKAVAALEAAVGRPLR